MFLAFVLIWFLREVRAILFWLYLWQLKEYHIGRFLAHFQTAKGKRLLLNPLTGFKLTLLGFVLFVPSAIYIAIPIYAAEVLLRKAPRPVFTLKVKLLTAAFVCFLLAFALLESLVFLLIVDIATPLFASAVVLILQPFAVVGRAGIVRRAKKRRRKFKKLKVIGITGSYGKTSTKEFLAHILGQKFQVLKTPEHANSEVGISRTILRNLTDEHDIFVCEMGAYNKGGIKLLADIAKPDIGIVTGVNEQHLATFGSVENLLSAEGGKELIEALPKDGALIINQKSKIKIQSDNAKCKIIIPQIPHVKVEKERISFETEGVSFRVPVYGGHNVQNLLLAIAAARELGMSLREIAKAAETMPLEIGALKVWRGTGGITVIDSTYSANPDGVIADLEYLNLYEGKKVLVMPCLIELGKASKEVHRRIGEKIAEVCDLAILTTGECLASVKEGARQSDKIIYMEHAQYIFEKIKEVMGEGGAVLLEGGKESRTQRDLLALLSKND